MNINQTLMTALLAMNDIEQLNLANALVDKKIRILTKVELTILNAWQNYFKDDEIQQSRNLLMLVSLCLENGVDPIVLNNAIGPLSCFLLNTPIPRVL